MRFSPYSSHNEKGFWRETQRRTVGEGILGDKECFFPGEARGGAWHYWFKWYGQDPILDKRGLIAKAKGLILAHHTKGGV